VSVVDFIGNGIELLLAVDAQIGALGQNLPFMHSESNAIHAQAMALFDPPGLESNLRFEVLHRDIIARFGRYPHRNAALGRLSTPSELAFLAQPGSAF
jgi:uncharacterized protein (DUF924 family)